MNEKQTIKDKYPLPLIDEGLGSLGKSKYLSTLDLKSGYHQIKMNPKDIEKSAFLVASNFGHFDNPKVHYQLVRGYSRNIEKRRKAIILGEKYK